MRFPFIAILLISLLAACSPGPSIPASEKLVQNAMGSVTITTRPNSTPTQMAINDSKTATRLVIEANYTGTALAKGTPTPKPTATRTTMPTYTPAVASNISYTLREWTADQADILIAQISSQLKASEDDPKYHGIIGHLHIMEQYTYLAFTEKEALLRFPQAAQTETWRWDLCYNLAYSFIPAEATNAPELSCYAHLIESGLNTQQTDMSGLSGWFRAHESRVEFDVATLESPKGVVNSQIIRLDSSAFFWLTENDGKFKVTGLKSSMFYFREASAKFQSIDLTGDSYPELVLEYHTSYCCGVFTTNYIYDLSSGAPRQLTLSDTNGTHNNVSSGSDSSMSRMDNQDFPGFLSSGRLGDLSMSQCDLREHDQYSWNGSQFELTSTRFDIQPPGEYDNKELCNFAIGLAKDPEELNIIANALNEQARYFVTKDKSDILLFRLGEYNARLGNYARAVELLSKVSAAPDSGAEADPNWIQAAQKLLNHYETAGGFYKACSLVDLCDTHSALKQVVANIQPERFPLLGKSLAKLGIPVNNSGAFDFDRDGLAEQWIVLQRPGEAQREFWIVVKNKGKLHALFVENIAGNIPDFKSFGPLGWDQMIELSTAEGKIIFSLRHLELSAQPYILVARPPRVSSDVTEQLADKLYERQQIWQQAIDSIAAELLAGQDPNTIKETLIDFKQSNEQDCKKFGCDQVYYLIGLANELSNDRKAAAEAYYQLWKEYPDSFYTLMARTKLNAP